MDDIIFENGFNLTKDIKESLKKKYEFTLKRIESIKEIDRANFKLCLATKILEKSIREIQKEFSVPKLSKKKNEVEYTYVDSDDNFYELIRNVWVESLSEKDRALFEEKIKFALRDNSLSYFLYDWLRGVILYNPSGLEFPDYLYDNFFFGISILADENEPLSTSEKYLFKKEIEGFIENVAEFKDIKKELIKSINSHPSKKIRRKRKVDDLIKIIKEHKKEVENFSYYAKDESNFIHKKTYGDIASELHDDDNYKNKSEKERLKKLKQRNKSYFEK